MSEWTEAKNDRRCQLIDKDMVGSITAAEHYEMDRLQEQFRAHVRKVAPLPIAEVTALHDSLTAKSSWTVEKNDRRCDLIDKEHAETITPDEYSELELLREQWLEAVTPARRATATAVPKHPYESRLFWTAMAMVIIGAFEVRRAIDFGHDYRAAAVAIVGGILTIVFRRFTDRPFLFFTKRGQRDGGNNWGP